jgi:hypothetical protein
MDVDGAVCSVSKKSVLQNHSLVRIVLVLWVVSSILTLLLFLDIDRIVHHDLYEYGLQFNITWASHYWGDARAIYILMLVPAALSIGMLGYDIVSANANNRKQRDQQTFEKTLPVTCSKCNRKFRRALVMLDFTKKPPKRIRVCPYCHTLLNNTVENDSVMIHVAEPEKVSPSSDSGRKAKGRGS